MKQANIERQTCNKLETRRQAVARTADRTASHSQHTI